MGESPGEPGLHLPWVQRPRLLAVFALVCLFLVIGAFAAGRFVRSASDLPETKAVTVEPAYAQVVERVVEELPTRDGTVAGRSLVSVPAPSTTDAAVERSVVSRTTIATGDTVRPGRLLCVVSGRPVFLLRLPVPLYRSLYDGDTGDDVREVQRALTQLGLYHAGIDGVFGPATQAAVAGLYGRAGFTAPRKISRSDAGQAAEGNIADNGTQAATPAARVWLPLGEVFGIAQRSAVVADVTARGTVLTAGDAPIAELRTGGLVVRARISVDERELYAVGTRLRIRAPDLSAKNWKGTVTAVSGFRQTPGRSGANSSEPDSSEAGASGVAEGGPTSTDGGPAADLPGYDITVRVAGDPEELTAGRRVTVVPTKAAAAPGPAVPLTAIRQDTEGTYVITDDGRRVAVQVVSDADGWAALEDGALREGTRVRVSP